MCFCFLCLVPFARFNRKVDTSDFSYVRLVLLFELFRWMCMSQIQCYSVLNQIKLLLIQEYEMELAEQELVCPLNRLLASMDGNRHIKWNYTDFHLIMLNLWFLSFFHRHSFSLRPNPMACISWANVVRYGSSLPIKSPEIDISNTRDRIYAGCIFMYARSNSWKSGEKKGKTW